MSHSISRKTWIAHSKTTSNELILSPLFYTKVHWFSSHASSFAHSVATEIQKKFLDQGDYLRIMREFPDWELHTDIIEVELLPAQVGGLDSPIKISLPYGYAQYTPDQIFAFIPYLNIEIYTESLEEVQKRLIEAFQIQFQIRSSLDSAKDLLPFMWWSDLDFSSHQIDLTIHTFHELEELQKETQKKTVLHEVSTLFSPSVRETFEQEENVERLLKIDQGFSHRCVLLIGPRGCGKSMIIREWVRLRNLSRSHSLETDQERVWRVNSTRLIQKLMGDNGWQDRLTLMSKELFEKRGVLYVTDFAQLFEIGRSVGNQISVGERLKEHISCGQVILVSECTPEEYAHIENRYHGILTLFQTIKIQEPSDENLSKILDAKLKQNIRSRGLHMEYTPDVIPEVIQLHQRFHPYSGIPAKPWQFLDLLLTELEGIETTNLKANLKANLESREQEDSSTQEHLNTKTLNTLNKQREVKDQSTQNTSSKKNKYLLNRQKVIHHFCDQTGLPEFLISPDISFSVSQCKHFFQDQLFGQAQAIEMITHIILSIKSNLIKGGQPISSMLFVGPTGVGKTEMAKILAHFLFSSRERMIRFDMSEFSDLANVMRLVGDEHHRGLLTSAVNAHPFCVLLFDEIEKAHSSFYDLLLQILGAGRLTSGTGETIDFCSTLILMTSNIGTDRLNRRGVGFLKQETPTQDLRRHFLHAVEHYFRPELFNRIHHIIPFLSLDQDTIRLVLNRELAQIKKREGLHLRKINLMLDEPALNYLAQSGYNEVYGARYLQRMLHDQLVLPLATLINRSKTTENKNVRVTLRASKEIDSSSDVGVHEVTSTSTSASNTSTSVEEDSPLLFHLQSAHENQRSKKALRSINLFQKLQKLKESEPNYSSMLLECKTCEVFENTSPLSELIVELQSGEAAQLIPSRLEKVIDLRRWIARFMDSPSLIKAQNQYDLLDYKKKKVGEDRFWKDPNRATEYTSLMNILESSRSLFQDLQEIETFLFELYLSPKNIEMLSARYVYVLDQHAQLHQRMSNLLSSVFTQTRRHEDQCRLVIYASEQVTRSLLALYSSIASIKDFSYDLYLIWNRSGLEPWDQIKEPKKEDEVIIGAILNIKGECAYTYFKHETEVCKVHYSGEDKIHNCLIFAERGCVVFYDEAEPSLKSSKEKRDRRAHHKKRSLQDEPLVTQARVLHTKYPIPSPLDIKKIQKSNPYRLYGFPKEFPFFIKDPSLISYKDSKRGDFIHMIKGGYERETLSPFLDREMIKTQIIDLFKLPPDTNVSSLLSFADDD